MPQPLGDARLVAANYGRLTFSRGGTLGFTVGGIRLIFVQHYAEVLFEELCDTPADYLMLGGPVMVKVTAAQWDAPTRAALAPHFGGLTLTTEHYGRKMSELAGGSLSFAPGRSGLLPFSAKLAVPLLAFDSPVEVEFSRKPRNRVTTYDCTFGLLPPPDGGKIVQVG